MTTVHQIRFQDLGSSPSLTALCAGFEDGVWRADPLTEDLFDRHLASFALSYTDFQSVNGDTAARMLRKAAEAVYSTQKYGRRGEFGELILHAAARDFFSAQPAISKIHFKDSPNDTVKGFDSVHIVEANGDIEFWLGEVKFYESLTGAISDVTKELKDHLNADFLRREFTAITNKLDPNWPHTEKVIALLDRARTLDEIRDRLTIPVLLTYDSGAIANHSATTEEYLGQLEIEVRAGLATFIEKLDVTHPVTLHLILAPLESKKRLANLFHQRLGIWKHI